MGGTLGFPVRIRRMQARRRVHVATARANPTIVHDSVRDRFGSATGFWSGWMGSYGAARARRGTGPGVDLCARRSLRRSRKVRWRARAPGAGHRQRAADAGESVRAWRVTPETDLSGVAVGRNERPARIGRIWRNSARPRFQTGLQQTGRLPTLTHPTVPPARPRSRPGDGRLLARS